ncbi:hypothetical protein [Aeromicrobium wangtongii]|uniref:Polysaccharide chain length determinant N-terminal domain-containing protein n=1 Tax=Aeromicrobium wangtongii TaxID=2969247 RepID=A0ABY5MBB3_9ACTN|nr:hypothetical protein [Aeromicrobium wangtongii]MCD9196883.1 hypothetical protein [Aeromicrobium wangtongii]UUP14391.1 hypothetical protein NQV15_03485 [Aeromicrobium wangtongii]
MTATDALLVLRQRWYIVLAGLLLTGAVVVNVATVPAVYVTQADVLFLAPQSAQNPNPIKDSSESLIATTGLVARMVRNGKEEPATASSGVTLTGKGVRRGYSIRLPDSGGQWANNFDRPELDIQVVGPSKTWVRSTLDRQVLRINRALHDLQAADGAASQDFITTSLTPAVATVVRTEGQPKRAVAAVVALGTILTALAALGFDRTVPGARRRRAALQPQPMTQPRQGSDPT